MLLFLLGGSGTGSAASTDYPGYTGPNVTNFAKKFEASLKQTFDYSYVQGWFIQLEKDANGMAKTMANGIQAYQKSINTVLFDAYKDTIEIGASMQDVMGYVKGYADALGRVPNISKAVTVEAIAFSKAVGVGTTEVGQMIAKFSEIGIGQSQSLERMKKIYTTARKYGVDAGTLTKTVSDNIKMASTYGFKGGVEGLTKMAARAQQLGIDFKLLNGVITDAMDPDKAIEMAAGMQMLGGNVGALGDPFQLLYMAQNDVGKLQEEFINVTSAAVDFNDATGEFKVPVSEMYRLKEMASKLGLNYDQIADAAVKAAKQKEVLSRITLPGVSDEDKNLIASLSEINNGKVEITLPDGTVKLAESITPADISALKEQNIADNMSMEDIAKRQLSTAEKSEIALNKIEQALINQYRGTGKDANILQNLQSLTDATNNQTAITGAKLDGAITKFEEGMTDVVNVFKSYISNPSGFEADVDKIISALGKDGSQKPYTPKIGSMTANPVNDLYVPTSNSNPVVMSKGQAFKGIPEDEILMAPNIKDFLQSSNTAFNTLSDLKNNQTIKEFLESSNTALNTLSDLKNNQSMQLFEMVAKNLAIPTKPTENLGISLNSIQEKPQTTITKQTPEINFEDFLSKSINKINEIQNQVVEQKITTTQKVEGNVGVDGNVNINVNVPNGLLSNALSGDREFQQSLKEEIMNVVNDRLSKAYSQRQGNFSS